MPEHQASLSFTISWSSLKFMSIESVVLSNHLILHTPTPQPLPAALNLSQHQSLFQWVSSSHQAAGYWSLSLSISLSNENSGLISFMIDWFVFLAVQVLSGVFSSTTIQRHQFFGTQPSFLTSIHDYWKNCSFDYTDCVTSIQRDIVQQWKETIKSVKRPGKTLNAYW